MPVDAISSICAERRWLLSGKTEGRAAGSVCVIRDMYRTLLYSRRNIGCRQHADRRFWDRRHTTVIRKEGRGRPFCTEGISTKADNPHNALYGRHRPAGPDVADGMDITASPGGLNNTGAETAIPPTGDTRQPTGAAHLAAEPLRCTVSGHCGVGSIGQNLSAAFHGLQVTVPEGSSELIS